MRKNNIKRRRYMCANMHRFTTLELVVEEVSKLKEKK